MIGIEKLENKSDKYIEQHYQNLELKGKVKQYDGKYHACEKLTRSRIIIANKV